MYIDRTESLFYQIHATFIPSHHILFHLIFFLFFRMRRRMYAFNTNVYVFSYKMNSERFDIGSETIVEAKKKKCLFQNSLEINQF